MDRRVKPGDDRKELDDSYGGSRDRRKLLPAATAGLAGDARQTLVSPHPPP
jgi:hypothetical protein